MENGLIKDAREMGFDISHSNEIYLIDDCAGCVHCKICNIRINYDYLAREIMTRDNFVVLKCPNVRMSYAAELVENALVSCDEEVHTKVIDFINKTP